MDKSDKKLLQILIDGQAQMKQDIRTLREDMNKGFDRLEKRIDRIGLQVAELEDDAPTREEFDELDGKVTKLQHQFLAN
ncbi:hypothetical protein A2188_02735 [Candidatus Woesebacteria bacterium RIFOXYA1_FULL_43_9]|uniref:Uncharacterized protein n=1 Tax=Candidatus Woesebacteria bacterium RIFOXYA1_FULL_43_9 TaxID=1802534 RepID=A0A1F8CN27_9BACT|nr:MAG: hypothetical protein A2188_02735 [Candidatus Woesebacteria bacterium RIFOXYA1_FULL_43_9]